ncbi:MAG: hypothetical protein ACK547_01295 [Alphaproteobacteria bacterium]
MDLIERYLGAIARQLSDAQKADVCAELRDVLLSQVEDEEGRLGRPQTQEELEAMLIRFGHPLTVAGRYRKTQHLIGPEVFPFWWAALKMSLAVVLGIYVVLVVLTAVGGEDTELIGDRTTPTLTATLLLTLGAVTLVFALMERFGKTALLNRWKPGLLPPASGRSVSPFEAGLEIGVGVVFILWWIGFIQFRNLLPDHALRLDMAQVWTHWFWPILIFSAYELAANLLALLRPGQARLVESLLAIRSLVAAAMLCGIYQAGHWVVVSSATLPAAELAKTQANFDRGMAIAIAGAVLVYVTLAGVSLWRLRQADRAFASPAARRA